VCLMGDGLCSRPDCNHYSDVHVQLPYFFHQRRKRDDPLSVRLPAPTDPLPIPPPPAMLMEENNPVDDADESLSKDLAVPVEEGEEFPLEQTSDLDTENPVTTPAPNQAFPDIPRPPEHQAEPFKLMGMKRVVRPPKPPSFTPPFAPKTNTSVYQRDDAGWNGRGHKGKGGWKEDSFRCQNGWSDTWKEGGKGWRGHSWNSNGTDGGFGKSLRRRGQMWVGPPVDSKVRKDVKISEGDVQLGFEWQYTGEGKPPQVTWVDGSTKVGQSIKVGVCFLRLNGLDISMFNQKQITDMLKQRPLTLRFGDE